MSIYPWQQAAAKPSAPQEDFPTFSRRIKVVTPAATEPVTADQLAGMLKVTTGDEAANLTALLGAARAWVEAWTGRICITQVLQVWLDGFPADRIVHLPGAPVSAVASMSWFDDTDTETVMDPAVDYQTDMIDEPARLVLRHGIDIPTGLRAANGLQVTYTAGYGPDGDSVPLGLRQAILALAADAYLAQGSQVDALNFQRKSVASPATLLMLEPFKIWR